MTQKRIDKLFTFRFVIESTICFESKVALSGLLRCVRFAHAPRNDEAGTIHALDSCNDESFLDSRESKKRKFSLQSHF